MLFDALRATVGMLAMLSPTVDAGLQDAAATTAHAPGSCASAASSSPSLGTIFGSLGSAGGQAVSSVKVLPKSAVTLDFVAYLGGAGTPAVFPANATIEDMAAGLQRDVARMQSFMRIPQQSRTAVVDATGAFTCGNLPPGEYLVLAQTQSSGYYVAMARVPVTKRNAKQRFLSPASRFVPAATIPKQ